MTDAPSSRSRAPMSGPGYDFPVPLNTLPQGARFVDYTQLNGMWGLPDSIQFGTVLWVGAGSVEIWWDHDKQPTRCQPELPVYKLDEEDLDPDVIELDYREYEARYQMTTSVQHGDSPATTVNPQIKALIARLNFQYKGLSDALEGDDKAKAAICMNRLQTVIVELRRMKLQVPAPPELLQSYEPLLELLTQDQQARATEQIEHAAAETRKQDNANRHADRELAKERHQTEVKTAKAKGTGTATPRVKGDKKLRPCLDGCGAMVAGNFAMGHDAKLKSLLIKVERGDQPLDAIPEVVMDLVKIVKGEATQERDSQGNPKGEPKQTFQIVAAPVKFPGRPEVQLTKRDD